MEPADFVVVLFALALSLAVALVAVALNLVDVVYGLLFGILGAFATAALGLTFRRLVG